MKSFGIVFSYRTVSNLLKRLLFSWETYTNKHFLFSKKSWRRFEDFFRVTIFHFLRRLHNVFKNSSRRLRKTCFQDVSSRRVCMTSSSRRCKDFLENKKMLCWRHLQYVFTKTTVRWNRCSKSLKMKVNKILWIYRFFSVVSRKKSKFRRRRLRGVFRTQCNICDGGFCENSQQLLKMLYPRCSTMF